MVVNPLRVVKVPARITVSVLLPGAAAPVVIEGRTAKLIAWVVQHRARIERVGIGAFILHLGLDYFTPEIQEHFPRQEAARENLDVLP